MPDDDVYEPTRRKPQLIWTGRRRRQVAEALPCQVMEIVRPFQAGTQERLELDGGSVGPNRLIWTNDNLVALAALIAGDTQHEPLEGKIDLIYIDPPFAVQTDFVMRVEIDEDLTDEKLPTLIEELVYTDTWRDGLDSYLSTMRDRLDLMKRLLAPTGSIFVHCDWHASHYLKVLLDEAFGYEMFRNEIIWKRKTGRVDTTTRLGVATDSILFYTKSDDYTLNEVYGESDPDYIEQFYRFTDANGRRYRIADLSNPAPRPNLMYEYKGYKPPRNGWAISRQKMELWDQQDRLHFPKDPGGRIQRRRFLDELKGQPILNLWQDISAVGGFSQEKGVGFPTQKPRKLLDRIVAIASNPGDLVLDAYSGSGTTAIAAETIRGEEGEPTRRRWIAIDCSKFGIHLTRKRLIEAQAAPFAVETVGFYHRSGEWNDIWKNRPSAAVYREALVDLYGGEPATGFVNLHGKRQGRWVHVGPLDAPVTPNQVRAIVEEALTTEIREVDILSADISIDWSAQEADDAGVRIRAKIIPQTAIDAVRDRFARQAAKDTHLAAAPDIHFFSPPDAELSVEREPGSKSDVAPAVVVKLLRITVDLDECLETQDPKKRAELRGKIKSWEALIDYWAIDWDWQDGSPFQNDWQSFRTRKQRSLVTDARHQYSDSGREVRVAIKVTDIFGNDGLKVVRIQL